MRSVLALMLALVMTGLVGAEPLEWSTAQEIPGLKSYYGEVDVVFFDGSLHVLTADRDHHIIHAQLTDGQWGAPIQLAHHRTRMTPAVTTCDGTMHMVTNPGSFKLAHSVWDGRTWGEAQTIPDMQSGRPVSITAFDGVIHTTHQGKSSDDDRILYAANAGWGWGYSLAVPNQKARSDVALAGLKDSLHMVHVGNQSRALWHSTRDQWGEWSTVVQIPGTETSRIPDLVAANGRLYAFYTVGSAKMNTQASVAYSVYQDGQWLPPVTVEGYVSYGRPVVAMEPGLPARLHLLLPTKQGVLHMHTEGEATLAPMPVKTMKLSN